jgi:Heliorhodopsin
VGIFVSLFLLFNTFAVNMWLQYRGIGLAPLRLRGVGLPRAQPDGEERARVADLRRRTRDVTNRASSDSLPRLGVTTVTLYSMVDTGLLALRALSYHRAR